MYSFTKGNYTKKHKTYVNYIKLIQNKAIKIKHYI